MGTGKALSGQHERGNCRQQCHKCTQQGAALIHCILYIQYIQYLHIYSMASFACVYIHVSCVACVMYRGPVLPANMLPFLLVMNSCYVYECVDM